MFSKMALGAIWGYQQFVSPYKGFRCAYAVRHGGTGCSGYAKHAIRDHGVWHAIPAIRQRLRDCKTAYHDLKASCSCASEPLSDDERAALERRRAAVRKQKRKGSNNCTGCCDCGFAPMACAGSGPRAASNNSCIDINPCDGDIGCGSCDACSCDICSCG